MSTQLNVSKLSFNDVVGKLFQNGRDAIARAFLKDEDVMEILEANAIQQVTEFRQTARQVRARMLALTDPDTQALEPLERLQVQRQKMVQFAGQLHKLSQMLRAEAAGVPSEQGRIVPSQELVQLASSVNIAVSKTVMPGWLTNQADAVDVQIRQGAQEIKALSEGELAMYEQTYSVLGETYQVALNNLKQAEEVLRQIQVQAPGIVLAIQAHKEALNLADDARQATVEGSGVNSFMGDLQEQMNKARSEYRADHEVDADLDAQTPVSFADMANAYDVSGVDADIMAEISAAAG